MQLIKPGTKLHQVLGWVQAVGASDLHLQDGKPARYRIYGRLLPVPGAGGPPLPTDGIAELWRDHFAEDLCARNERIRWFSSGAIKNVGQERGIYSAATSVYD